MSSQIHLCGGRVPALVHNVCVSAVVRFRSRVLAHETKCGTKIKTYSLHLTAPLQKHFVMHMCRSQPLINHTDASALILCRHVRHWHRCGFSLGLFKHSIVFRSLAFRHMSVHLKYVHFSFCFVPPIV